MFDSDELGPEGDSLWSRLLAGVGLFEEMKEAAKALESLEKEMDDTFPLVDFKAPITDVERAKDNDDLNSLTDYLLAAQTAVGQGVDQGVSVNETEKRAQDLEDAKNALNDFKRILERKKSFRANWNASAAKNEQAIADYLNSFSDE